MATATFPCKNTPGMLTDPAAMALAPARRNRAAVDRKHIAVRLLEHARVGVVVRSEIERRQKLRGGILPQGRRLHHPRLRHQDVRILYPRQPEGGIQVDRNDVGPDE